jgi:low affinity Fe/Cu permease
MSKTSWFTRSAKKTAHFFGRPAAFVLAVGFLVIWAICGPLYGFSEKW